MNVPYPPNQRPATARPTSPFLHMGVKLRWLVIGYLVFYRIIFPTISYAQMGHSEQLFLVRWIIELFYTMLLAYPLVFYRQGYGWLHPLIIPTIFDIIKDTGKNPFHLVLPLDAPLISFTNATTSYARVLTSLPVDDLATMRVYEGLLRCFALAVYYFFFLNLPRMKVPQVRFAPPRNIAISSIAGIGICLGIALAFLMSQGGLSAWIVAMRGGRAALFSGQGQYLAIATFATAIALVWFVYSKRPFTNPLFLGGLAAAALTSMLATGSRGSLVYPIMLLVFLWWRRSGKIIILQAMPFAIVCVVAFVTFGAVRQDYGSNRIDLSILESGKLTEIIESAAKETSKRDNEEPELAVFVGTHQLGHLWGKTYVGAASFWIPRALWPNKPRTADAYNMWYNFVGNPIGTPLPTKGFWGIPVNGLSEAYWNFDLVGVLLFAFGMALVHRFLTSFVLYYSDVPVAWVFYLSVVVNFQGSSGTLIDTARDTLLLILFCAFAGIISLKKLRRAPAPAPNLRRMA